MKLCIQTTPDLICIRLPSRLEAKIVISNNLDSEDSSYCFVFIEAVRGQKFTHSSFARFSRLLLIKHFQTFFLLERKNSILKAMAMLIINSIYLWNLSHFHRKKSLVLLLNHVFVSYHHWSCHHPELFMDPQTFLTTLEKMKTWRDFLPIEALSH